MAVFMGQLLRGGSGFLERSLLFIFFNCVCVCSCVYGCMYVCIHMCACTCESQRSSGVFTWVLGIKPRSSRLCSKHFTNCLLRPIALPFSNVWERLWIESEDLDLRSGSATHVLCDLSVTQNLLECVCICLQSGLDASHFVHSRSNICLYAVRYHMRVRLVISH